MIKTQFIPQGAASFLPTHLFINEKDRIDTAYQQLISQTGQGSDFLGWLNLPETPISQQTELNRVAQQLSALSEAVLVIGIGGSYLGARAVIEALQPHFTSSQTAPRIYYAGNHLSEDYLFDLKRVLDKISYSIIVISKSGTTTEPAIAFRIFKEHCEQKYGKEAASRRIVVITDKSKGALRQLADNEGYTSFTIENNVGGRYSVLSPVGLLPIATAGFNISQILVGAKRMKEFLFATTDINQNIAMQYALIRNYLYHSGKKVELMVAYEPRLFYFIEWYKQLFGESEGKEQQGIFPTGSIFTTDLHSLGQYVQEGKRFLFETVISVETALNSLPIPFDNNDIDGLNYLQQKSIQEINRVAETGTRMAHIAGGVPNLRLVIPSISENILGELIFFFEFSCALSGYLLNVNPFDQPGVEAYKKNMFQLLGKQ